MFRSNALFLLVATMAALASTNAQTPAGCCQVDNECPDGYDLIGDINGKPLCAPGGSCPEDVGPGTPFCEDSPNAQPTDAPAPTDAPTDAPVDPPTDAPAPDSSASALDGITGWVVLGFAAAVGW